jgi:diguanylate cyclase (GGDEF)-like protein
MEGAPKAADELSRLTQLRSLALLDTDPEERFDRVTRLAQRLFDVPIALVSLVDEDRQWFKSRQGLEISETPREVAFCAHAILGDEIMTVDDALADPRFADNPLVLGDPKIRFYAGAPISGPGGAKLGTLCIIDREPRGLTAADAGSLRDLAEMVEREIAAAHLASGDELTGLSNRRGFELLGSKVLEICVRLSAPATMLYIDLDEMKRINDVFGHEAGDHALREFARHLDQAFRGSDVIARLGGDEFAVLLLGSVEATRAVQRLQAALAARTRSPEAPFDLRASIGSATYDPTTSESLQELAARADAAMYAEKQLRRGSPPAG